MKKGIASLLILVCLALVGKADPITYTETTPPHPLMRAPEGWQIVVAKDQPFTYTTKLKDGQTVSLVMPAYQLLPVGTNLSYFIEPGYAGTQNRTLDQVMKDNTLTLDEKIAQLKTISSQLGQIGNPSK